MNRKIIIHLATWYPSKKNPIDGIFIKRHIQLLATDKTTTHIVIRKSEREMSILRHLLSLLGFFKVQKDDGLKVLELPQRSFLYRRFFWRFKDVLEKYQLKCLIRKYKPSINHLHVVYGFGKESVEIKKGFGIPFIISEHMAPFPFDWIQDKETYVVRPMEEASAVVAVGGAQAEEIRRFTGVQSQVIPNMVNSNEFHFQERQREGSNNSLQIILVGIYDSRKGADYLLEAMPGFIKKNPGCILHLAGEANAERMRSLLQQVESTGLEQSVKFHGVLTATTLCKLYNVCDFYVCASSWESFGVSVLEALFVGLPVLATKCGGVLEFVNAGNGILIENDRKEKTLIDGMMRMTRQLAKFDRFAISEEAIEKFSGEKIKKSYYKIYKEILDTAEV